MKSVRNIKDLYEEGVNIMQLLREMESGTSNSLCAISLAYDLQAGSYIDYVSDPRHAEFVENYTGTIASMFDNMDCHSILEAGVGEATTLVNVMTRMPTPPSTILGFDLSWSRIAYAREYSSSKGVTTNLFLGNLLEIPILSDSIDVVYTSHTIEPNRDREKEALRELHRVAKRYLVLLEPSNELGSEETRRRIEEQRYCRDLYRYAKELSLNVVEYRLFDYCSNLRNQTALMIIEKGESSRQSEKQKHYFACPSCKNILMLHKGNYYCEYCFMVYPVISGIPCLMLSCGILASQYIQKA